MADPMRSSARALPLGPIGPVGVSRDAMLMLIVSEAALFAYLLFAYFYTAATTPASWLLEPHPALVPALPNTLLLVASSFAAHFGQRAIEREERGRGLLLLGVTVIAGTVFALVQLHEWSLKHYTLQTSSYSSLYYLTTGAHLAHVVVGLVVLSVIFGWTAAGYFSARRSVVVSSGILYWHFVDVIWLCVFVTYYITPYLGFPS